MRNVKKFNVTNKLLARLTEKRRKEGRRKGSRGERGRDGEGDGRQKFSIPGMEAPLQTPQSPAEQ